MDFSETIEASDLKGSRADIYLILWRYVSIEGQGHFFTIYFSGFVCFVLYLDKISGERLQDHWSSGSQLLLTRSFLNMQIIRKCMISRMSTWVWISARLGHRQQSYLPFSVLKYIHRLKMGKMVSPLFLGCLLLENYRLKIGCWLYLLSGEWLLPFCLLFFVCIKKV